MRTVGMRFHQLFSSAGQLYLTGSNKRGQLGLPDCKEHSSLPMSIAPVLDARITQVSSLHLLPPASSPSPQA